METKQLFSCCTGEMRRFIFNRLQQTDNQKTLYTLRLISKSEQERVENKIQTAKLNFCHIEKFASSKFSERIKFLQVCLRKSQDCYESFRYLSDTYLPYAVNIYVKVYPIIFNPIGFKMLEPLIFRRLHIVNYSRSYGIYIVGKYNVEIRDCEFIGISVNYAGNANVYVTGSKFIKGRHGLGIGECDSVYIDEITLDNCGYFGLLVDQVRGVVNITNVRAISCPLYGIVLNKNFDKFQLSNTIIKDCVTGIRVAGPCSGEIQKTNIEQSGDCGIELDRGAIVYYAAVHFKHCKQDVQIFDDISQFLPLENI